MKAARSFRAAQRAMIDQHRLLRALGQLKEAQNKVGVRVTTERARIIFVACIYNLALLGRIKDQGDVDAWLTEQWKARGAVAEKRA